MAQRSSFGFLLLVTVVAIAGAAGWVLQWRHTMTLRTELDLLRLESGEVERLRAENKRLREKQIPAEELEALRADHAALPRLRAELEALRKSGAGEK